MNHIDFSTVPSETTLAHEVACLKATLSHLLKAIGQADAGKVIINMEKYTSQIEDPAQAEVFSNTIKQIKHAYRQ